MSEGRERVGDVCCHRLVCIEGEGVGVDGLRFELARGDYQGAGEMSATDFGFEVQRLGAGVGVPCAFLLLLLLLWLLLHVY